MSSAHQVILAVIHRFFESNFKKSIVLSYDSQNSRNTCVSGVFSCPKTGFCLIFSLIGSTGGNCTDKTLHAVGTFALHLVGHMAVYVQRKGRCGVAPITLHRLDIVAGADRGNGVGVTQIVEMGAAARWGQRISPEKSCSQNVYTFGQRKSKITIDKSAGSAILWAKVKERQSQN